MTAFDTFKDLATHFQPRADGVSISFDATTSSSPDGATSRPGAGVARSHSENSNSTPRLALGAIPKLFVAVPAISSTLRSAKYRRAWSRLRTPKTAERMPWPVRCSSRSSGPSPAGVSSSITVSATCSPTARAAIPLRVVYYDGKGKTHRLPGATVTVAGGHGPSTLSVDRHANYGLTLRAPGRYRVTVSKTGYVRDETTIKVTR